MRRLIAALLPLLVLAACGAPAQPEPVPPAEPVSPVYTDWSKLTPYEPVRPVYTLHRGYSGADALEARRDYGALLPYIGKYAAMEGYVIDALPFFGLVTDRGELVTDPVYAGVQFCGDFLVLYRGDPDGAAGGDAYDGGTFSQTLAAADGRWVRELADSYYVGSGCGLLLTAAEDGALDLWDRDGELVTHFDSALFTSLFGEEFRWNEEGGPYVDWTDDRVGYAVSYYVGGEYQEQGARLYLDFSSGAVTDAPPEGYGVEIDYGALFDGTPEPPAVEGCNYLEPITDQVSGETYFYGYYRKSEEEEGSFALFDGEGRLLVENCGLWHFETSPILRAGLCAAVEDGCFCLRSLEDGALVFRWPMRSNSD